jgi:glycosyltransferase involved in cell wall biosynthesis
LLARALTARGHQVVLLGADTGKADGVVWEGVTVRNGGRFDTGGVVDTLRAVPRVRRILREERPDWVVVYGWTTWLYVLTVLRRGLGFRVGFVCALDAEIDGAFRHANPVRGAVFQHGLRRADVRLAITENQAVLFRAQAMPCAVTRLLLQDVRVSTGEKSIDLLWVARCHPVKQPHRFLDLAEQFPEARCRMICSVQDAALWESVAARAARLPQVEFLEAVPYRDIQSHFNAARIFVNTSRQEGVPNTFIHSGLGGAAIVSLTVDPDGMFGTFRAGVCARGDFAVLTEAVRDFLAHPDELATAQAEASRFVREWHDNRRNVAAFLDAIGAG